jgi:hypothetical protein
LAQSGIVVVHSIGLVPVSTTDNLDMPHIDPVHLQNNVTNQK